MHSCVVVAMPSQPRKASKMEAARVDTFKGIFKKSIQTRSKYGARIDEIGCSRGSGSFRGKLGGHVGAKMSPKITKSRPKRRYKEPQEANMAPG